MSATGPRLRFCPVTAKGPGHFFRSAKVPPDFLSAAGLRPPFLSGYSQGARTFLPVCEGTTQLFVRCWDSTPVFVRSQPRGPDIFSGLRRDHPTSCPLPPQPPFLLRKKPQRPILYPSPVCQHIPSRFSQASGQADPPGQSLSLEHPSESSVAASSG